MKAVLQQGIIVPLEPLPPEWVEGTSLEVAKSSSLTLDTIEIDAWVKSRDRLCADRSPSDEEVMHRAIEEQRQQATIQVLEEMSHHQ